MPHKRARLSLPAFFLAAFASTIGIAFAAVGLFPSGQQARASTSQGPVAAYSFDKGEGTTLEDNTGNGNDGTIENAKWVSGKYGQALDFDGAESCVTIPNSPELQLQEEFTFEAWVRPENAREYAPLLFKQTGEESYGYNLWIGQAERGNPVGEINDGTYPESEVDAPEPLLSKHWSHVAFTNDGGHMRLYVNGKLVASAPSVNAIGSNGSLQIGCAKPFKDHFEGKIDEVQIYNRALAEAEVQSSAGSPIEEEVATPVAEYSFDEDEGTVVHDDSGHGHDGTLEYGNWAEGKYGSALGHGCVTIPNSPQLQLGGDYTLEAWVQADVGGRYAPLIFKQREKSYSYSFWMGRSNFGQPTAELFDGSSSSPLVTLDSESLGSPWHHLALVNDGAHQRIYVDGELAVTGPGGSALDSTGPLTIGCENAFSDEVVGRTPKKEHLEGRIDEVRIFNRALSQAEVQAGAATPIQTPPRGPVAAYSFDRGEGTALEDDTGNGHTGTISGAEWVKGKYGDALKFDGTNSCVSIADVPDLRLGGNFTLESWVKPEGAAQRDPVIFKEAEAFPSYGLGTGLIHAGKPEGTIGEWPQERLNVVAGEALEANVWSHVAATFDGTDMRLYVDGVLVGAKAITTFHSGTEGALTIGCDALDGSHFKGRIDEVRIYNRALGAGELEEGVERPVQVHKPESSPVAAYAFNASSGSTAADATGNGHEATIENAKWVSGKYGDALNFDGAKSCLTIPDSPELQLREEFTLEAWVRPEYARAYAPLLFKQDGQEGYGYIFWMGQAEHGNPVGEINDGTYPEPEVDAPEALASKKWSHVAFTNDGGHVRVYVDGRLVASAPSVNAIASNGSLQIGCAKPFEDHFEGKIDEVRLYNRALGEAEVQTDAATPIEEQQAAPVAAYSFDEGSGTVAHDATGNGHDGTIENAEWVRGKYGGALNFTSSKSCVTVPNSPQLQLGGDFTLEAWVRPEFAREFSPLFFKEDSTNTYGYVFWVGQAGKGKPVGEINDGTYPEPEAASSTALTSRAWSHVAFTNDAEHMRVYVNGDQVAEAPDASALDSDGTLQIGCGKAYSDYFDGRIDEVRIYNRALAQAEVQADAATPIQAPQQGPVAAYSFDEGEGATAEDITGHGHTATIEGAEWTNGKYGDALKFDGTSACVSIVDAADLRLGEEFTLESWVKPEGGPRRDPVIFKEAASFPSYGLGAGLLHSEKPEGTIGQPGKTRSNLAAGESLEEDVWKHIALTFDGAKVRLYVNGVLANTKVVESPVSGSEGPLTIGCDALDGSHFKGRIDEVRIYNRALPSGELMANIPAPPPPAELEALFFQETELSIEEPYVVWQPSLQAASNGTGESEIKAYRYSYRVNGGPWGPWTTTNDPYFRPSEAKKNDTIDVRVSSVNGLGVRSQIRAGRITLLKKAPAIAPKLFGIVSFLRKQVDEHIAKMAWNTCIPEEELGFRINVEMSIFGSSCIPKVQFTVGNVAEVLAAKYAGLGWCLAVNGFADYGGKLSYITAPLSAIFFCGTIHGERAWAYVKVIG